jgi:hypothetical protein
MSIEDQVAPFIQAERMARRGFPQETLFEWCTGRERDTDGVFLAGSRPDLFVICAAPTVAEMGEWMPAGDSTVRRANGSWTTGRGIKHSGVKASKPGSRTESESRARMLLAAAASKRIDPKSLPRKA